MGANSPNHTMASRIVISGFRVRLVKPAGIGRKKLRGHIHICIFLKGYTDS